MLCVTSCVLIKWASGEEREERSPRQKTHSITTPSLQPRVHVSPSASLRGKRNWRRVQNDNAVFKINSWMECVTCQSAPWARCTLVSFCLVFFRIWAVQRWDCLTACLHTPLWNDLPAMALAQLWTSLGSPQAGEEQLGCLCFSKHFSGIALFCPHLCGFLIYIIYIIFVLNWEVWHIHTLISQGPLSPVLVPPALPLSLGKGRAGFLYLRRRNLKSCWEYSSVVLFSGFSQSYTPFRTKCPFHLTYDLPKRSLFLSC